MKRSLHRLLMLVTAIHAMGTAIAQEVKTPKIADLRLSGEEWSCTADESAVKGMLLKPAGDGPFPAIILSHGLGGNAQTMMRMRGAELVKWGFVCIATDYTHAGKSGGRGNQDGIDFTKAGARPENIQRGLVCLEILRQQKDVDPKRIALYGHSMGAFLTIALAAAAPDKIAAAAITAGGVVTADYRAASAPTVEVADRVRAPFLILHGTTDTTVLPQSSERLKQCLDSHGVPNARHLFEGVGHGLPNEKSDEVNRLMREWFTKHGVLLSATDSTRPAWVTRAVQAPRLQFRTFESAAVRTKVSYHLFIPEAYDTEPERRFPVLYWLHGSGGGLAGIAPVSAFFDQAIRAGKIPPMLVVFPNGLASSMWCDSKDGAVPMETVVIKELIPHIDATFRTLAKREARLIEGFSMGGYGAARLGLKYPDVFGAVSVLAGGPLDLDFAGPRATENPVERERILKETWGGDMAYYRAQSPLTVAEQNAALVRGKVAIRQVVGDLDNTLKLNRAFSDHLGKLEIPHTFANLPGVTHDTMALFNALGDANWGFYRAAFGTANLLKPSAKGEH
jgi:dienelactone hydrolase